MAAELISFEVTGIDHEHGCVSVTYIVQREGDEPVQYPQNLCGLSAVVGEEWIGEGPLRHPVPLIAPVDLHDDDALLAALQEHARHYRTVAHKPSGLLGKTHAASI